MTSERLPPIACSLQPEALDDRIGEWRAFGRSSVTATVREATRVRFRLVSGDEALIKLASLAQREKECCPFFEFVLLLEPTERWLVVSVPVDGVEILQSFADLVQPT